MHGPTEPPRGERHHLTKLTADDVRVIRHRHREGESTRKLGREYGMAGGSIHRIVTGATWGHV
jgi:hypothetical protein